MAQNPLRKRPQFPLVWGTMEIQAFAERVLFSTSLSTKLETPQRLTDASPGAAILPPKAPARPSGLGLASSKTKRPKFPTLRELETPLARGHVLHFFANHELLALELMALTLLRFPGAPKRFRKRLVATMRDEQKHMKLYMDRMADFDVEMGEIPLNSFFWDQLSQVADVREFAAGMSLTFEQANLDFSLHYRNLFQQVGDETTADIMAQVLKDEVAHVRHGVDYLNRTRSANLSQWQDYLTTLNYPLTPARAKGSIFTRTHREAAGLDAMFIDQLEVYAHSKGRVPNVYLYNPDTERCLAHPPGAYSPSQQQVIRQRDLDCVPMFLAAKDDVVAVHQQPSAAHLAHLQRLGYAIPEFAEMRNNGDGPQGAKKLSSRKLGQLIPWGWDHNVSGAFTNFAREHNEPSVPFKTLINQRRHLSSKTWLAAQFASLLARLPDTQQSLFVAEPTPRIVTGLDELKTYLNAFHEQGYPTAVMKAPFGTAGGQQVRILEGMLSQPQTRWFEKHIMQHGAVLVEPWFENLADLSYLFRVEANGQHKALGLTHFLTDEGGRYRGTILGNPQHTLPERARTFLLRAGDQPHWLSQALRSMVDGLSTAFAAAKFTGLAGIDVMIVRDHEGSIKCRAPLELNPRSTMGHIALALRKPLGSRATGLWLHVTQSDLKRAQLPSFEALMQTLHHHLDTHMSGNPLRMTQGVFATNDIALAQHVLGICLIAKRMETIQEVIAKVFGHTAYAKMLPNRNIEH